ncbi:hypothetical protein Ancab_004589, partial [Ancistrocladus abbreviatus]
GPQKICRQILGLFHMPRHMPILRDCHPKTSVPNMEGTPTRSVAFAIVAVSIKRIR